MGCLYLDILVILGPFPIGGGSMCALPVSAVVCPIGVGRGFHVLRAVPTVYGAPHIKIS